MAINDFYRGDTKKYKFQFTSNGLPVDITGWQIWYTLKNADTDADIDAVLQVNAIAGGDANDDPVNGLMYVTVTSVDSDIPVASYAYDFQRVIPGNPPDVRTLDKGKVKVLQDVTQANA